MKELTTKELKAIVKKAEVTEDRVHKGVDEEGVVKYGKKTGFMKVDLEEQLGCILFVEANSTSDAIDKAYEQLVDRPAHLRTFVLIDVKDLTDKNDKQ